MNSDEKTKCCVFAGKPCIQSTFSLPLRNKSAIYFVNRHSFVQTTLGSVEQLTSTQNFMSHAMLVTYFLSTDPSVVCADLCQMSQMGGSKFEEVSCT